MSPSCSGHHGLARLARQRHDPGRGLCEGVIYPSLSPGLLSVRAISNPGELTSAWEPSAVRLKSSVSLQSAVFRMQRWSAISLQSVVVRVQYKLAVYKKLVVCSIQNAVNLQSAVFRSPVRGPLQLSLTTMLCRLFIMLFRPRPPMPPSDTSAVIRVWWILFGAYLLMTGAGESYNFSIKLQIRWWMSWAWLTPRIWHHDSEGESDIPHVMWHVNTKYLQLIVNQSTCYIYIWIWDKKQTDKLWRESISNVCCESLTTQTRHDSSECQCKYLPCPLCPPISHLYKDDQTHSMNSWCRDVMPPQPGLSGHWHYEIMTVATILTHLNRPLRQYHPCSPHSPSSCLPTLYCAQTSYRNWTIWLGPYLYLLVNLCS